MTTETHLILYISFLVLNLVGTKLTNMLHPEDQMPVVPFIILSLIPMVNIAMFLLLVIGNLILFGINVNLSNNSIVRWFEK